MSSSSRYLLSDGGEKHGLAEGRYGRRCARLLLRAQREGPPIAREEGELDAGRITIVRDKLQAFYVYEGIMKRTSIFFLPES